MTARIMGGWKGSMSQHMNKCIIIVVANLSFLKIQLCKNKLSRNKLSCQFQTKQKLELNI